MLLGAAVLGAACTPGTPTPGPTAPDPALPLEPLAVRCGGQRPFVATGTEPGWRLTLGADTLDLEAGYGTTRVRMPTPAPRHQNGAVVYGGEHDGHAVRIDVRDGYCTNAMSGKPFPCMVRVTLDGDAFDGCGGDPASLLTGGTWRVQTLNGAALPAGIEPTLQFRDDATVSGFDGCNRFRGRFAITGIGVDVAAPASTPMACPEDRAAVARELHAVLEATGLFALEDGRLILGSHGEPRLTARR